MNGRTPHDSGALLILVVVGLIGVVMFVPLVLRYLTGKWFW
jgi:hypothetical protein